jgi:hypothetical protein
MRWLGFVTVSAIAACGHDHASTADGGIDAGGLDAPPLALGPLMPQEVAGDGSAIMTAPTIMAITYDGDANRADVEAMFQQYAASPAWAQQTAEYGIGPLAVATPQHLAGTPAANDAAIRQLLTTNLTGATPAWGAPSESTVYSFTIPVGATYDDGAGSQCCVGLGGYHDDVIVGGVDVAYSIECGCGPGFIPNIPPLEALTMAESHELVEAVTDPRFEHDYAWGDVDGPHEVWSYITDGELADLCEFASTTFWTNAPGMTYTIQRIWSNAAARAGTDPCIGAPAPAYYQSVPVQSDDVSIALYGSIVATKGTKVGVGATGAITLQVAGTPGSGPFTVTAVDAASLYFGASSPLLVFAQPSAKYNIGDTVTIPVTVMAKDGGLGGNGAEAFEIDTTPMNGGPTTYFYGLIGQ